MMKEKGEKLMSGYRVQMKFYRTGRKIFENLEQNRRAWEPLLKVNIICCCTISKNYYTFFTFEYISYV